MSFFRNRMFWAGMLLLVLMIGLIRYTATERHDITIAEKMIRDLYTPLQSGVNGFQGLIDRWGRIIGTRQSLVDENQRLRSELNRLQQERQVLLEYRYENDRLREMLDFKRKNTENYRLHPAEVIARSPELWYKTLTIDQGERDGITRNMVAITPQGLVGRVTAVSAHTSEVLLISDRESAVGVLVQQSRTQGLVEGLGDRNTLKMVNIPYDAEVRPGQVVVTSGLSEIFPRGIRVGKITRIITQPNGLLKYAFIQPAVDFDKLEEVFIVFQDLAR
ncbi:MAG: rod shape-determining protein MreC [Syntrophomonadaceae bacterium]|nr:rod shape-determining protein MreC [Syntrophomonadaceae bacterium]